MSGNAAAVLIFTILMIAMVALKAIDKWGPK